MLLLLVLLPLGVNPWGGLGFAPFKASLLRAAAALLLAFWIGGRPRLRLTGIVRGALLVLAATTLSTAFSVEPAQSALGSFDRGGGWLTTLAGVVILLVSAHLFVDPRRRERAITAFLLGALVPCGYAILQHVGVDPIDWQVLGEPGSTLGSPTFLAGYLVIVAPLAGYRVLSSARASSILGYASWLALSLVVVAVIVQTTIRGPLLALLASAVTFGLAATPAARLRRRAVVLGAAIACAALAVAVSIGGPRSAQGLQRFTSVLSSGDSSIERLTVWRDALTLPFESAGRFLVGFGPEAQSVVLERAERTVRRTQNQQWDRAHNLLVDTWLTTGAFGVLALLSVLGAAGFGLCRTLETPEHRLLAAALLAALVGHVVEASFAFETVVTGALFWVLLALAAGMMDSAAASGVVEAVRPGAAARWRRGGRLRVFGGWRGTAAGGGLAAARLGSVDVGTGRRRELAAAPSDDVPQPGRSRASTLAAPIGTLLALIAVPVLCAPAVADAIYGAGLRARAAGDIATAAQLEESAAAWAPWVEELPREAGLAWNRLAQTQSSAAADATDSPTHNGAAPAQPGDSAAPKAAQTTSGPAQGDPPRTAPFQDDAPGTAPPQGDSVGPTPAQGSSYGPVPSQGGLRATQSTQATLARAEADLLEAARRAPLEPTPHLRLARWYFDLGRLEAAAAQCDAARAAGPYRAAVWDICGDISQRLGRTQEATARHARAEELRHLL